jgi:hypothetical protein
LRSYVREYCLRRVVLSPLPDGAGAGAANPAVPLNQGHRVVYQSFKLDELDYEEIGPEQAVVVNILQKLALEHPGHRYGTLPGQIDLCGSVDPNALVRLWLDSAWTASLWSAAVRNRTRSPPPSTETDASAETDESHSLFPAVVQTQSLLYGYDISRLQKNANGILEGMRKLSRPRVYIKSDVNRLRIFRQTLKAFFEDQDRVLGQSTDSLVRELAGKMDLEGCESSILSFLKNDERGEFFKKRRDKRTALATGVAQTGTREDSTGAGTAQKRPRDSRETVPVAGAGGRHVPGARTAKLALADSRKIPSASSDPPASGQPASGQPASDQPASGQPAASQPASQPPCDMSP